MGSRDTRVGVLPAARSYAGLGVRASHLTHLLRFRRGHDRYVRCVATTAARSIGRPA